VSSLSVAVVSCQYVASLFGINVLTPSSLVNQSKTLSPQFWLPK